MLKFRIFVISYAMMLQGLVQIGYVLPCFDRASGRNISWNAGPGNTYCCVKEMAGTDWPGFSLLGEKKNEVGYTEKSMPCMRVISNAPCRVLFFSGKCHGRHCKQEQKKRKREKGPEGIL
jgi:hypothetical protein